MAANEKVLGALHEALTQVLIEQLKGQETESYFDPETGEEVAGTVLPPSAAVMTVAAKFLKDNNITCIPAEDNELGALQKLMEDRQKSLRNGGRKALDAVDIAGIAADTGFAGSA